MAWFKTKRELAGVILFPGNIPPQAKEFAFLSELGIRVKPAQGPAGASWVLDLEHREWGKAKLTSVRAGLPPLPEGIVEFSSRLDDQEKDAIRQAKVGLYFTMDPRSGHILRDRKHMLRMANAILGTDGIAMIDLLSMLAWTPPALQDELAHDADLDVEDIFAAHCVSAGEVEQDDKEPVAWWAHTHGLQEVGRFDFDFLFPSADALSPRTDFMRAVAFAVLEETIKLDGGPCEIVQRAPAVQFVSAARFAASGSGRGVEEYKAALDESHRKGHGMGCDAEKSGFFAKLFGKSGLRPSQLASGEFPDGMLINFSTSAGELMGQRAQKTVEVFSDWMQEFAEFEATPIAKLRFETNAGGAELPWFQVHAVKDGKLDATCINDPFDIPGLANGDRGEHDLERLADWMIILPFSNLSPRSLPRARRIRASREQLREVMRAAKAAEKK